MTFNYLLTGLHSEGTKPGPTQAALTKLYNIHSRNTTRRHKFKIPVKLAGGHHTNDEYTLAINNVKIIVRAVSGPQ